MGLELQSPDLTALASFRIDSFFLLPLLLGLDPVLTAVSSVAGVDYVTEELLVEISVIKNFWVVFTSLGGTYPLPFTPINPSSVNHL